MAQQITVDDILRVITRKSVSPGQITLYKALYEAGDQGLSKSELAAKVREKDEVSLTGVLGALGNRVNQTDGLKTQTKGVALLIEKDKVKGELHYRMRSELRKAIEALPQLREAINLTVGKIYAKYRNKKDWLKTNI